MYTIEQIKEISVPVAKRYGVEKLALFGSYARGDQREDSDIDFLVNKGDIIGYEFYGFINALEDELGTNVDVITYGSLKEAFIYDVLINEVKSEEVILYER